MHVSQWAIAVILRTFGHKWSKKNDTGMVEGLLEAYYKDKHEKMIKSEFWVIGTRNQKLAFFRNFLHFLGRKFKKCIFWWSENSNILAIIVGYSQFISKMGLKILYMQ